MSDPNDHPSPGTDIDLSKVIADSISNLAGDGGAAASPHHQSQEHSDLQSHLPQNPPADSHDDLDLESAIGDVFSSFDFAKGAAADPVPPPGPPAEHASGTVVDPAPDTPHQSSERAPHHEHAAYRRSPHQVSEVSAPEQQPQSPFHKELSEEALDEAIGNAFKSALNDAPELSQADSAQHDDVNLDEAIGNAFSNLLGKSHQQESARESLAQEPHQPSDPPSKSPAIPQEQLPEHPHAPQQPPETPIQELPSHSPASADDDDASLQDAIGNAFSDIFQNAPKSPNNNVQGKVANEAPPGYTSAVQEKASDQLVEEQQDYSIDNDLDLDAAIGDAFKSILPTVQSGKGESRTPQVHDAEHHRTPSQEDNHKDSEDDVDLENVIGEAFKSIGGREVSTVSVEPASHSSNEEVDDDELSAMISATFKKAMDKPESSIHEQNNTQAESNIDENLPDDKFMENAITEAFMSAMENNLGADDSATVSTERRVSEGTVDISRLVQNLVTQMATEESEVPEKLPISQDVLKELAMEITSQVQDHLTEDDVMKKQNTMRDLPQIEENVLAHFQQEANKDDRWNKKDSSKNKLNPTAIAQVVRNAIKTSDTQIERRGSVSNEANDSELEKLSMGDIIQNAFNMAMENPQELLSDLEMDEDVPLSGRTSLPLGSTSFSSTKASEVARPQQRTFQSGDLYRSRLDAQSRAPLSSFGKNNTFVSSNKDLGTGKSLSIAETLALHRSSMNVGPRRDYSTIESLEEALKSSRSSNEPIRSQISSVISSISSRMNNNRVRSSSDQDLLGAIQQMTNMLTSDSGINNAALLSILRETPSVTEIISTYKELEEKEHLVNSLLLAKSHLSKQNPSTDENNRAVALIENVIQEFNQSSDALAAKTSLSHIPSIKSEVITNISRSVISAISNYASTPKLNRTTITTNDQVKEEEDLREKIRLENRARKKRWREENSERNKDNDLRSRVWRRAAILFGEKDTAEKKDWADKEFEKRRDKRIARREKQTVKNEPEEPTPTEKDEDLVNDPKFIKPVTDIFNIVSGFTNQEDSQAALAATSVATAAMAAVYATNKKLTDFEKVDSAVSTILANLVGKVTTVGQHQRMTSLTKGINTGFDSDIYKSKLDKAVISTRKSVMKRPSAELNKPTYDSRKSEQIVEHDAKKQRLQENDTSKVPDATINSPSPWGVPILKMPQYKNSEGLAYGPRRFAGTSAHSPSPFISNKANFGMDKGATKPANTGLRKPGSFQRPISKPERKGFGAAAMHSTL